MITFYFDFYFSPLSLSSFNFTFNLNILLIYHLIIENEITQLENHTFVMNRIIFVVSKVRILDQIWSGFGQESQDFEQKKSLDTLGEYSMQIQSLTEFKPFLQNSKILRHWRDSWEAVVLKMPQNHQLYPKSEYFLHGNHLLTDQIDPQTGSRPSLASRAFLIFLIIYCQFRGKRLFFTTYL